MRKGVLLLLGLAGCSGGSDGVSVPPPFLPPPQPLPVHHSIGGIWEGTNAQGYEVMGMVTEDGDFLFVHELGAQVGNATVTGNEVHSTYTYFRDHPEVGSSKAECTLSGVVVHRRTLTLDSDCPDAVPPHLNYDINAEASLELRYNRIYEQGSSLEIIAGLYEITYSLTQPHISNTPSDVLRIDSNGLLFRQAPGVHITGVCTQNGEVSVLDPAYNIYLITYVTSCSRNPGGDSTWKGFATLYTSTEPDTFVYVIVGEVPRNRFDFGGVTTLSLIGYARRL